MCQAVAKAYVIIKGEYIRLSQDDRKERVQYNEKILLHKVEGDELHQVIKKRKPHNHSVLDERLRSNDTQFSHVRTHHLHDVVMLDGRGQVPEIAAYIVEQKQPREMSRAELLTYVK